MITFADPQQDFVPESQRMYLGAVDMSEALQMWRRESCEEFTGGKHPFEMTIEEGQAQVGCPICHYNPLENGDLHEFMYFGPIPVDIEIRSITYPAGPWGGPEYDVEVEVTPR